MKKMIAPLAAALAIAALPAFAQDAPAAQAPAAATPAAAAPAGAAQPGRAGKHGAMRPLAGRVAAKADDTLTITVRKHGGAVEESKFAIDPGTRFAQVAPGAPGDLTEGYLVAVAGERQDGKIAATGILRLAKPEGKGQREALRSFVALGRGSSRLITPPVHGQKPAPATIGRIVAAQPLTIETVAGRKGDKAEKIEVTTAEATRILCLTEAKLADLEQNANVLVLPKPGAEGAAPAAAIVVETPRAGRAGAGKGRKK